MFLGWKKRGPKSNATVEHFISGEDGEWMLDYDIFLESSLSHYQQKTTSLRRSPTKHEIENNPQKKTQIWVKS